MQATSKVHSSDGGFQHNYGMKWHHQEAVFQCDFEGADEPSARGSFGAWLRGSLPSKLLPVTQQGFSSYG